MPTEELPWNNEAAFTRLLLHDQTDKASFHRPDIWHNTQFGIGKAFAANALVCLLEWFHGNGVETKLDALTTDFLQYCKDSRH